MLGVNIGKLLNPSFQGNNKARAVSIAQHAANFTSSGSTVAVTITATQSGSLLVAGLRTAGGQTVSSVSDGTNNFTQFTNARKTDGGGNGVDCWYLKSSTSGKTTITATMSGAGSTKELWVWEVSGFVAPKEDITGGGTGTGDGSNTNTGTAITTTSTKGFIIAVIRTTNNITQNPKTGNEFTSGGDIDSNNNAGCSLISLTAASHQPVWLDSNPNSSFLSLTTAFAET